MKKLCFLFVICFLFFHGAKCGEQEAAAYLNSFMPKVQERMEVLTKAVEARTQDLEALTGKYEEGKFKTTINRIKTLLSLEIENYK